MIVIKEISHHRVWMIDLISTPIVIAITLCIFRSYHSASRLGTAPRVLWYQERKRNTAAALRPVVSFSCQQHHTATFPTKIKVYSKSKVRVQS